MTPRRRGVSASLLELSDGVQPKVQENKIPLETCLPISPAGSVLHRADEREMCEEYFWRDASQGLLIAGLQLLLMKLSRAKCLDGTIVQCLHLHSAVTQSGGSMPRRRLLLLASVYLVMAHINKS